MRASVLLVAFILAQVHCAHAGSGGPFDFVTDLLDATHSLLSGEAKYKFRPTAKTIDGLTEDIGHLISFREGSAQQPLGLGKVELGIHVESSRLGHPDLWLLASGKTFQSVSLPRISARIGLPWDSNFGVSYYRNPSSGLGINGVEITHQVVSESDSRPAFSVGMSASRLTGVSGLELHTLGANLSISKSFGRWVPYTGLGYVRTSGSYGGSGTASSFDMRSSFLRGFIGTEAVFGWLFTAAEIGGKRGGSDVGIKLSVRF